MDDPTVNEQMVEYVEHRTAIDGDFAWALQQFLHSHGASFTLPHNPAVQVARY